MKKIKLFDPVTDKKESIAIKKVLDSNYWASGSGENNVKLFEKKFQKFIGSKNCVCVNSGTAALSLALSLCNIRDKEVILPSLTFVSTAHSVIENGGIPVFVDVDPKTLCISTEQISKKISKRTKAIIPVHFGGIPCDLKEISRLCKKSNLILIEDAAHSAGAFFNKKRIGKHGSFVCFSFHPVKNLAMPTGGLIALNDKNHSIQKKKLLSKRWCGITNRHGSDYDVKELGWNYYMNEFSAAIGLVQLKKLDIMNKKRQKIALRYSNELDVEWKMPYDKNSAYHFYWVIIKNRKKLRDILSTHGIETGTHYKPVHTLSMYKSKIRLPTTEKIGKEIVTLPTHPNLSKIDVDRIIRVINNSV
ncbi:DegT/DnrJ/EryC1/StrS family aminotransferase [Candidatus Nitrosopelagicus sp.]|nr:DegT/DnrJ/EryC1/StrS family aminotransferase [Candidatus Nitrosopelagicus sp.]